LHAVMSGVRRRSPCRGRSGIRRAGSLVRSPREQARLRSRRPQGPKGCNRRPPAERCRLVRQACGVGADLQHGRTPIGHPAPEDNGHVPAGNERVELHLPTLRKSAQNGRQLVQPCADFGSEPRGETPTGSIVDPGQRAHAPTVAQPRIADLTADIGAPRGPDGGHSRIDTAQLYTHEIELDEFAASLE
jgi:hypothetical protein